MEPANELENSPDEMVIQDGNMVVLLGAQTRGSSSDLQVGVNVLIFSCYSHDDITMSQCPD